MATLTPDHAALRPVVFVAREPDETLRTFLPVVDVLRETYGVPGRLLFHHTPGTWAREELERRHVPFDEVAIPPGLPGPLQRFARGPVGRTVDEVARFWRARRLARRLLARVRPSAVVVIQDTLLFERFLVREANRRGLPTLVVQWAFSYPQALYDRIRTHQHGSRRDEEQRSPIRRLIGPVTRRVYRGALSALGLSFELAPSYGGGEARLFAVMGDAFGEQYVAQGVRGKQIVATGHPTHDAVFRRAQALGPADRQAIRQHFGIDEASTVVLYATQPVLWRRVMTAEALERNVCAMAAAVHADPSRRLVVKLHPRERLEQYAFCQRLDPPVTVIPQAEMPDLIAACDLFVSSSSSTVLLAMMLDRPIVTVNFDDVPHFDVFESIGGTLHVRTYEEFSQAVEQALTSPAARERLDQARARVLARYTRFDGQAAERIAALLADALAVHRPLAEATA
ncbi:MAG: CDP-glycerol glycerophosphotransferase family protein [Chloroflexi bacterium]|nr:CDP-glycerol glycerophosphotransferase family protein [Chloroflexota bacterium]